MNAEILPAETTQELIGLYEQKRHFAHERAERQQLEPSYDENADDVYWEEGRQYGVLVARLSSGSEESTQVDAESELAERPVLELIDPIISDAEQKITHKRTGFFSKERTEIQEKVFSRPSGDGLSYVILKVEKISKSRKSIANILKADLGSTTYRVTEFDGADRKKLPVWSMVKATWEIDEEGVLLGVKSWDTGWSPANKHPELFPNLNLESATTDLQLERLKEALIYSQVDN